MDWAAVGERYRRLADEAPGDFEFYGLCELMTDLTGTSILYGMAWGLPRRLRLEDPGGRDPEGTGVVPDESVPLRLSDLRDGRDAPLEAAANWPRANAKN